MKSLLPIIISGAFVTRPFPSACSAFVMRPHRAIVLMVVLLLASACRDFVEVGPPPTALTTSTVFENDATANAAMIRMYVDMVGTTGFAGGTASLTNLTAAGGDELVNYYTISGYVQVASNSIAINNNLVNQNWTQLYRFIYSTNAVIEGLTSATGVSADLKSQLLGEAHFMRAYYYFYLVNLWGDVPLLTATDYEVNRKAPRTSAAVVYNQIIADLKEAELLLGETDAAKTRPGKAAATAMLARVYLFTGQWAAAEAAASAVLNTTSFALESDLSNVFKIQNTETIWQLQSVAPGVNTWDGNSLILNSTPRTVSLTTSLINAFEPGDARRTSWVGTFRSGTRSWYYPFKYKVRTLTEAAAPKTEYLVTLRLAEQWLIRAEARAQQSNLPGALEDLNMMRTRASLPPLVAMNKEQLLSAIMQENRVEFFAEWAHRWLDLKRTNTIDAIVAPLKTDWQPTDAFWPIPATERERNTQLTQNPGY